MKYFIAMLDYKIKVAQTQMHDSILDTEELANCILRFESNIIRIKQKFRKFEN